MTKATFPKHKFSFHTIWNNFLILISPYFSSSNTNWSAKPFLKVLVIAVIHKGKYQIYKTISQSEWRKDNILFLTHSLFLMTLMSLYWGIQFIRIVSNGKDHSLSITNSGGIWEVGRNIGLYVPKVSQNCLIPNEMYSHISVFIYYFMIMKIAQVSSTFERIWEKDI